MPGGLFERFDREHDTSCYGLKHLEPMEVFIYLDVVVAFTPQFDLYAYIVYVSICITY